MNETLGALCLGLGRGWGVLLCQGHRYNYPHWSAGEDRDHKAMPGNQWPIPTGPSLSELD